MSHFSAILNVLESVSFEKEMSKAFFENYLHEYLQLSHSEQDPISETDYQTMQEVAAAVGISEQEFDQIVNEDDKPEEKEEAKKDKYDHHLDNIVDHPPGTYEFGSFLNKWYTDSDTEPTITTPGYAH
jgi:hypothetical protein